MASKKRDYRAEYKRRIARGKARGLSRAQAAGHPKVKRIVTKDKKGRKRVRIERVELGVSAVNAANARAAKRGIRPILPSGATLRDVKRAVKRDALYAFGEVPKRQHEDGSAPEYQLRLELLESRLSAFDWKNESKFIAEMMALGLSERQAYSQWFSPGGTSS